MLGDDLFKEKIQEVLSSLTDRERRVLTLRFGLDDGCQRTLEEVGNEFNVTRERVRQIEAKALRKMRHPTRASKLFCFIESYAITQEQCLMRAIFGTPPNTQGDS